MKTAVRWTVFGCVGSTLAALVALLVVVFVLPESDTSLVPDAAGVLVSPNIPHSDLYDVLCWVAAGGFVLGAVLGLTGLVLSRRV